MIDTHCHLTFPQLIDQIDTVLNQAQKAGVDRMISVGTTLEDSRQAGDLARRYASVYATAGIHPHYADRFNDRSMVIDSLCQSMDHPKVVAIGEMGLDHHYRDPPIDVQQRVFQWQLDVARDLRYPIVIHNRQATEDVVPIIRDSGIPGERFVFHCFTGSAAELEAILELGAMVSFTGVVTFKNSQRLAECLLKVPLERLMVETDAPYLTPEPHRKIRPNQPCYVADVARFIADHLGIACPEFIRAVDHNAERFFRFTAES